MKELEEHVKSYKWSSGPFEQAPAGSLWKYRNQFEYLIIRNNLSKPGCKTIEKDCIVMKLGITDKGPSNPNEHAQDCYSFAAFEKVMYMTNGVVGVGWISQTMGNAMLSSCRHNND